MNEDPTLSAFEKILKNRSLTEENIQNGQLSDPYDFPDMQKVIDRIKQAIKSQERVMIFGDYDADGITSSAILFRALREMGANVSCRLPHREEDGYGLNMKFIDQFIEADVKLMITVDCGIASPDEVEKAQNSGIDTIVTDHHEAPLRPAKPYALLHSTKLAGAGVAFKLAQALLGEGAQKYIDLAAVGTIADVVPLTEENRVIAKAGLKQMSQTNWPGLKALMTVAQIENQHLLDLDSDTVGYRIGPRINAAGRIDDPILSLKVLISDDKKVSLLADKLDKINIERKDLVKGILDDLKYDKNDSIIVIKGHWPKGVLGLISGRITEETGRPSVVFGEYDGYMTGSARSPEFFHITDAFKGLDKYLEEYGGHRKAAGLTLKTENFEKFKENLQKTLNPTKIPQKALKIDTEIMPQEFNQEFFQKLMTLRPFGEQNEDPLILFNNVKITEARRVGATEDHISIRGEFGGKYIKGIIFRAKADIDSPVVSLAARIKKDAYAKEGFSLVIEDVKS